MQTTFSNRFQELLSFFKLDPPEVARLINLNRQTVVNLINIGNPQYSSIVAILKYFNNIDARWLLLGDGSMFMPDQSGVIIKESPVPYSAYEKEKLEKLWVAELTRLRELNYSLLNELSRLREVNNLLAAQLPKTGQ